LTRFDGGDISPPDGLGTNSNEDRKPLSPWQLRHRDVSRGGQAEAFPEASTSEADGNRPASPRIERLACHVTKRSIAAAAA